MNPTARRGLALLLTTGLLLTLAAPAPAHTLSKKRAAKAAYALAQRVGASEDAAYAIAGYCKRRAAHRVDCWAGIIWSDYTGAAQRVKVVLRGGKARATRYGTIYRGNVGERSSGESGGEWAICGIRSSVCIGS